MEKELEVTLDLGAGERCPGSPQTAGPNSRSTSSQVIGPLEAYPHIATPTLDLTYEQDLEHVDVGSEPDLEVNLSYQTPVTSAGLSASAVDIPMTSGILDTGAASPQPDPLTLGPAVSDPSLNRQW